LGVDLHCHKISSSNSSYFSRNQRFYLPISAQIDEQLAQNFSKKCEPEKAGPPAKAGLPAAGQLISPPRSSTRPNQLASGCRPPSSTALPRPSLQQRSPPPTRAHRPAPRRVQCPLISLLSLSSGAIHRRIQPQPLTAAHAHHNALACRPRPSRSRPTQLASGCRPPSS
jgi:hypothetical protein